MMIVIVILMTVLTMMVILMTVLTMMVTTMMMVTVMMIMMVMMMVVLVLMMSDWWSTAMSFELLNLWMKSFAVATQMKPLRQNFHMIPFVSKQFRKWNFHQILTLAAFGRMKGLPVNLYFDQLNIFQGGVLKINLNASCFITRTTE